MAKIYLHLGYVYDIVYKTIFSKKKKTTIVIEARKILLLINIPVRQIQCNGFLKDY